MFKLFYKILFIILSISFFVSAVEMDIGVHHNTFFDEYDTYEKTEQVDLDYNKSDINDQTGFVHAFYNIISPYFLSSNTSVTNKINTSPPLFSQKIFLWNSVWRI